MVPTHDVRSTASRYSSCNMPHLIVKCLAVLRKNLNAAFCIIQNVRPFVIIQNVWPFFILGKCLAVFKEKSQRA